VEGHPQVIGDAVVEQSELAVRRAANKCPISFPIKPAHAFVVGHIVYRHTSIPCGQIGKHQRVGEWPVGSFPVTTLTVSTTNYEVFVETNADLRIALKEVGDT